MASRLNIHFQTLHVWIRQPEPFKEGRDYFRMSLTKNARKALGWDADRAMQSFMEYARRLQRLETFSGAEQGY